MGILKLDVLLKHNIYVIVLETYSRWLHPPAIHTSKITACYDVKNGIDGSWHDVMI